MTKMNYQMKSGSTRQLILLLVFLFLCSSTVQSQVLISILLGDKLQSDKLEFGLIGGLTLSDIHNQDNSKIKPDFNLGFYFDIKLRDRWYLSPSVQVVSNNGARNLDPYALGDPGLDSLLTDANVERDLRYFSVPLLIKYRSKKHFFAEFGPQISLRGGGDDIFVTKVFRSEDVAFKNEIKSRIKPFDVGLTAGVGYRLLKGLGMQFSLRYYLGLMNFVKETNRDENPLVPFVPGDNFKNRSIYIVTTVPIGKGKAAKKKAEQEQMQQGN